MIKGGANSGCVYFDYAYSIGCLWADHRRIQGSSRDTGRYVIFSQNKV